MRILNIINSFDYGGAENLLLNSLSYFREYDHKINVLSLSNNLKLNIDEHKNIIDNIDSNNPKSLKSFYYLANYLKNNKYDIIHAHLFPTIYYCAILKKMGIIKVPLVITEHSTHNKRRDILLLKPLERLIYKSFNKIICISEGTKNNLSEWLGFSNNDFKTIYNGVNLKKFSYERPKYDNFNKNKIKIVMVASFSKQKDQLTLIKAFRLLPNRYQLYFAGEGPKISEAKDLVNKLNLADRVSFLGNRNDIPDLLKTMDLFVLSSEWEGFGLVIVEAMASGLPVIATDINGLSEVVKDHGALFQKGNYKELSDKISRITQNNFLYREMSKKSIKRANDFSLKKMVYEYINLYEKLLE